MLVARARIRLPGVVVVLACGIWGWKFSQFFVLVKVRKLHVEWGAVALMP